MYNVFIDGAEGTTGLKIHEYFKKRDDINIIRIDEAKRKDLDERLAMIKKADISFLCLPDAASSEIAAAAPAECRILDTSTAHRTNDDWVYGMPELSKGQRQKIKESNRGEAMAEELQKFGVTAEVLEKEVFISGQGLRKPKECLDRLQRRRQKNDSRLRKLQAGQKPGTVCNNPEAQAPAGNYESYRT